MYNFKTINVGPPLYLVLKTCSIDLSHIMHVQERKCERESVLQKSPKHLEFMSARIENASAERELSARANFNCRFEELSE